MKEGIKFLADFVNNIHDILIILSNDLLGLNLTDKDLHFWIMGMIGIITFFIVYGISKWISTLPFAIVFLSFLYTLTFMFVLVFAIEIQQALTSRGNMEFLDAIIGLWGFIVFFMVYIFIALLFILIRYFIRKNTNKKHEVHS